MRSAVLVAALLALSAGAAAAQASSDIFLADLVVREGGVAVGGLVNITARPGYDNQPQFTRDGTALLYTSIRSDGQADIFRWDLGTREVRRVTRTAESEYSPTPAPAGTGGGFSVVRVEPDSTQRLWRFAEDGGSPTLVLSDVHPVGYHAWGDDHRLALFILGIPATLHLADTRTGRSRAVAEDVGRSVQKIPGRPAVSFVQRLEGGRYFLVELNVETGRLRTLVELPAGAENHAWTPNGTVLLTRGAKLLQWQPGRDRSWREVADFTARGVELTRIAVSPSGDRIAIVGQPTADR
jgi:hypothetical protein